MLFKKFIFLFTFLSFALFANAQTNAHSFSTNNDPEFISPSQQNHSINILQPDSNYTWTWDSVSGSWQYKNRVYYVTDGAGHVLIRTMQTWNGVDWENHSQQLYTYDNHFNWTVQTFQNWDGTQWINDQHFLSSYDANDNYIHDYIQYWDGTAWNNVYEEIYWWNVNNKLDSSLTRDWDGTTWNDIYFNTYTYDNNNLLLNELSLRWDSTAWVNASLSSNTYNAHGDLTENLYQVWNSGAWEDVYKYDYTYDVNFYMIGYASWHWFGGIWTDPLIITYFLNSNNITEAAIYQTDQYLDSIHYYNTEINGINDLRFSNSDFEIFPNPVTDFVYGKINNALNEKTTFTLIDILGKELDKKTFNLNSTANISLFDLRKYPEGVYFIKASFDKNCVIKKIIKK